MAGQAAEITVQVGVGPMDVVTPAEFTKGAPKFPAWVSRGRHRIEESRGCCAQEELLQVEKEEGSILTVVDLGNAYGAADREAPVVLPDLGPDMLSALEAVGDAAVRVGQAGVYGLIPQVVVNAAMVLVGARRHGEVEIPARRLAILGCKIAGLDGYFLDCVHAGAR